MGWEYVELEDGSGEPPQPRIVVVGCGGGGCNSVHRLNEIGISCVETIAINTDRPHLSRIKAHKRLLIGQGVTNGMGAGSDANVGRTCAENAVPEITKLLQGAELTFVTWGSNKGPILDAMRWLENDGLKTNLLQLTWLNPFPTETVTKLLKGAKRTLLVECNHDGQLGNVIREKTGILLSERLLKYDGRPFYPEEVYNRAKQVVGGGR